MNSKKQSPLKETELYPPLKSWLEEAGYEVFGEVRGCDLAARREGQLLLVEMKLAINLDLLLQLLRRQEAEALVYAAVPAPAAQNKRWRELTRLLKRLEAGLILVHFSQVRPRVELAFHPVVQERRRSRKKTQAFLAEMSGRGRDHNIGGGTRQKLVTAYREQALMIARLLERSGPSSPKVLREMGSGPKTGPILLANHYQWFERLERGLYALSPAGRLALTDYAAVVKYFEASE